MLPLYERYQAFEDHFHGHIHVFQCLIHRFLYFSWISPVHCCTAQLIPGQGIFRIFTGNFSSNIWPNQHVRLSSTRKLINFIFDFLTCARSDSSKDQDEEDTSRYHVNFLIKVSLFHDITFLMVSNYFSIIKSYYILK